MRRVWQIYVAHVLLFVFYLASIHFLSETFNAPDFIDRFNVAPLTLAPVEVLIARIDPEIQAGESGRAAALRRSDGLPFHRFFG